MNVFWIAVLLFLILLCGVASIIDDRRHIKELEEEIDEEDLDTSTEIEIMMDEPSKGYVIKHGDMSIHIPNPTGCYIYDGVTDTTYIYDKKTKSFTKSFIESK